MRTQSIRRKQIKKKHDHIHSLASDNFNAEQVQEYEEAFLLYDKDGSGYITTKELKSLLRCLGSNPTDFELQRIVNKVEVDGNGKVDFPQFISLMEQMISPKEEIESTLEAFRVFDIEGRGYVRSKHVREMLLALEQVPLSEIDDLIEFSGLSVDRDITLEEFATLVSPNRLIEANPMNSRIGRYIKERPQMRSFDSIQSSI